MPRASRESKSPCVSGCSFGNVPYPCSTVHDQNHRSGPALLEMTARDQFHRRTKISQADGKPSAVAAHHQICRRSRAALKAKSICSALSRVGFVEMPSSFKFPWCIVTLPLPLLAQMIVQHEAREGSCVLLAQSSASRTPHANAEHYNVLSLHKRNVPCLRAHRRDVDGLETHYRWHVGGEGYSRKTSCACRHAKRRHSALKEGYDGVRSESLILQ
jgi:hypothetical protein